MKLFNLRQLSLEAHAVTSQRYTELVTGIEAGLIQLNTNYNGFQVVSIWDAKPIAWRPRPMYEYKIAQSAAPIPAKVPAMSVSTDTVAEFFSALLEEKDQLAAYDAEYQSMIAAFLRSELDPNISVEKVTGAFYNVPATVIRIYEVKVVK